MAPDQRWWDKIRREQAEWWIRIRHRHAVDRVVRHHTVETRVMGRGAVMFAALLMTPAAVVQAATQDSSHLIADFGGMRLSIIWAAIVICASITIWIARWIDPPDLSAFIEMIATATLAIAYIGYVWAVLSEQGWEGSLVVTAAFLSSAGSMLARSAMLGGQLWAARRRVRARRA